jgi:hypothetical protein
MGIEMRPSRMSTQSEIDRESSLSTSHRPSGAFQSHSDPSSASSAASSIHRSRPSLVGRQSTASVVSTLEAINEDEELTGNPMLTTQTLESIQNYSYTPGFGNRSMSVDSIASSLSVYEARQTAKLTITTSPPQQDHSKASFVSNAQSSGPAVSVASSSSQSSRPTNLESLRDIRDSQAGSNNNWFERNVLFRNSSTSMMSGNLFGKKKKKGTVYSSNSLLATDA